MVVYKIAGLKLKVNEVEYDGVKLLERTVYDGDERIAVVEEDEDGKYVVTARPGNRALLLGLESFDRPDDAVMALAKHLHSHRPQVDSVSGRATVLGDAYVTTDVK